MFLHALGLPGGASSSQLRRSFSFALGAKHPQALPARRPRGGGAGRLESQKGRPAIAPRAPSPTRTKPGPGPGYVTCRRSRPLGLRFPAGRAWCASCSPGRTKGSPRRLHPPFSPSRGRREEPGECKRKLGPRELTDLKKRAAGEGRSGPRGGKAGHLWGDRGRAGGGRGAATSPPPPAPGPRRRRQLHTQKPIVTAPDAQPRGLGPAAKRVSGPVSRAGLRDARAARAINSRSPGGPGGFPVTPGPAWEEEGAGDNEAAAASPAPPSPRRPARTAREWEGPSRARALPSRWDPRGSEPLGLR